MPFVPLISVTIHPMALEVEQVEPVKPFAQIQEQPLEAMILVPPLAQGVVCWHWARADWLLVEFEVDL